MIQVTKKHYIQADNFGYVVGKRSIVEEGKNRGKVKFTPVAYFSKFEQCLEWIADLIIREGLQMESATLFIEAQFAEMRRWIVLLREELAEAGNPYQY